MKTPTCDCICDFCGERVDVAVAHELGRYTICGPCKWEGVTADQITALRARPERVARNAAERLAHAGLWSGRGMV